MLLHLFYKLQLLNIEYFNSLKYIYRAEIEKLIYIYIIYISKEDFLSAFITAFCIIITKSNIQSGFCATELVLYNPEYIILQLDIRLCMPMLAPTLSTIWKPKTPRNIFEL